MSQISSVNRTSIYRWRCKAVGRPDGLAAKPHPHRPPLLTTAQPQTLESLLAERATAHGWHNQLWTTDRVATLIERHFQIHYHHDHVGRFLRRRLGWSVQKPRRRAKELNEEAIRRWQSEEFPRIAQEAQLRNAHLVFLDESGFFLTPTVRRTWGPRGQTPLVDAWNPDSPNFEITNPHLRSWIRPIWHYVRLTFDGQDSECRMAALATWKPGR
jgi:transposase